MKTFPHYKQPDSKDCGPTCLRIIAKHYGKLISLKEIREISETIREGSSLLRRSSGDKRLILSLFVLKIFKSNRPAGALINSIDPLNYSHIGPLALLSWL
nr:cysteine peptidase family C39 domain-containing protein [Algoriphagus ornithinivorans]